jgi:hypothetical protein
LRLFVFRDRLYFARRKEKTMARLSHQAHVPSGILIQNHANVHLPFVVLLDGLNGCDLPIKREVKHITAGFWAQPHPVAAPNLHTQNFKRLDRRFVL